jgi:hypothetical protein
MNEAASGTTDMTLFNKRFAECCKRRGLEIIDPSGIECGKLGLDVVLK